MVAERSSIASFEATEDPLFANYKVTMTTTTWHKTACILCSENCGLEVQIDKDHLVQIRGNKAHPESQGYICQKATRLDYYQNHSDRLKQPLKRQPDKSFEPVSWQEAIVDIAARLNTLKERHGGRCVAYYGGGGQGNHLGGVYGNSLREAIGTPYVYTALAQEKTGDFWVNGKLFGKQTCHITSDVEHADFVIFLGTNPWQSHGFPRARKVLQDLRGDELRTMVVIDPRRTETARMADIHLQLRPGTDAYLLGAILGVLANSKSFDEDFIKKHASGADEVLAALKAIPVDDFVARAGVSLGDVTKVAKGLASAKAASVRADLGIQQSLHSTLNSYLEKLLFLLTGNLGRPGTNNFHSFLVPLIGHSAEPAESKEVTRTAVTGMQPISKLYPPNILPQEIDSEHPGRVRAVIVDSANPLASAADTAAYRKAFDKLDLVVVIDVAMTETAQHADYILPASSQFEKAEATFFNLQFPRNAFHLRPPILDPLPGTLPEPEIYRRICVAMGALPENYPVLERVAKFGGRRAFAIALKLFFLRNPKLVPLAPLVLYSTLGKTLGPGLESAAVLWASAHFYAERHPAAVRRAGIIGKNLGEALFERLLTSRDGTVFSEHQYSESFDFLRYPDRRIHLAIPELLAQLEELSTEDAATDKDYPFTLMAGERRSYNANTIFRDPKWRKTDADGALRMHPDDATKLGLANGDAVEVHSRAGSVVVSVEQSDAMQAGVLSLPHGYGLHHPGDNGRNATGPLINELTSASHCDRLTKTPFHKTVPVRLQVIKS